MWCSVQTAISRGLAAFLVTMIIVPAPLRAAPGDIFTIPAPVIGADPPKATELKAGDVTIATATGAVSYSYPIGVPPGRNGMAPQLALAYSSQGATYGGVAVGWSLPIGMIREAGSRLETHDPFIEQPQGSDAGLDDEFVSSIAGESRLVMGVQRASLMIG